MKKSSLLVWALISQTCLADQAAPIAPLLETQQPAQQFVTSEPDNLATPAPLGADPQFLPPTATASNQMLDPDAVASGGSTANNTPATTPATTAPAITATAQATALGLGATEQTPADKPFAGGLDTPHFEQCRGLSLTICGMAKDPQQFQTCYSRLKQPTCKQFLAFATMTSIAPKDDIDVIKHYKQAQLDLVHLVRSEANYPGVYYTISASGDITDLVFGPQTKTLDIHKDLRYPEIASRFPNVELYSIVDKLPETASTPTDTGLRLILHFQLLNGCPTCERAGYANVAYDFSETGALQAASVLSLEPVS